MRNIGAVEKLHLSRIIGELEQGKFVIPDFQREFEWKTADVRDLIRSIFLDYYIGTLLLWKASDDNKEVLSCEPIYGFKEQGKPQHIVLDGQQRLTALYYAFFAPDIPFPKRQRRAFFLLHVREFMDENYDEAFTYFSANKLHIVGDQLRQFNEHIFPLALMGKDSYAALDWARYYQEHWKNKLSEAEASGADMEEIEELRTFIEDGEKFEKHLKSLLNEYYISYIELDKDIRIDKVCEIFTQINSKGVRLNIFDLLNAILRPHDIFLKDLWRSHSEQIEYTSDPKLKVYVLQVMSILAQDYCSPRYLYYLVPTAKKTIKTSEGTKEDIILVSNGEDFETKWKQAFKYLKKGIAILENPREFGAIKSKFLPYLTMVPIFSAIQEHVRAYPYLDLPGVKNKIKKWYWANVFMQNYSSSVESKSAKDFRQLKKWFKNEMDTPEVVANFIKEHENIDYQNVQTQGSAIYNAILNLLVINGARDWETLDLPDYIELDDHHIVPQSWGKENKVPFINSILNKTLLSPDTNRRVLNRRMPREYIRDMFERHGEENTRKLLHTHLVPDKAIDILLRENFSAEDYTQFLLERKKAIVETINYHILKDEVVEKSREEYKDKIASIENRLRDYIDLLLDDGNGNDPFKDWVNPKIREKVQFNIERHLKSHPALSWEDFELFRSKLDHFDLQELKDIIVSKANWSRFENDMKSKAIVMQRFNQLGPLRNKIAHNAPLTEIIKKDGEVAIVWFEEALREYA